jgi:hypothetical protein
VEPVGDLPGFTAPLRVAVPVRVTLTAHARGSASDLVRYRIEARSAQGPQQGVTVTARLTCLPGDAWLIGRPTMTTGQVTAKRRALVWRLDLEKASETAGFTVRVRPGDRSGALSGELTTRGPMSNCPGHRNDNEPVDPSCRATVRVPPRPAAVAHPVTPAPVARPPAGRAPAAKPRIPASAAPAVRTPGLPTPAIPAPAIPAPAIPAPAVPALPAPAPGKSRVLSQVDRAPLVPVDSAESGAAARPEAPEVVRPDMVVRSADYSHEDLSRRSFGFLLGAVALLLVTVAVAGRVARVAARRRRLRAVPGK